VLAGNIANADTPNYRARDFDFAAALQNALSGRSQGHGGLPLATTAARHLPGDARVGADSAEVSPAAQPSADGNTVEMDVERAQFAENSVLLRGRELSFITGKIRTMLTALQGQ
jgi:flagellar basal-body rod protein FlgB